MASLRLGTGLEKYITEDLARGGEVAESCLAIERERIHQFPHLKWYAGLRLSSLTDEGRFACITYWSHVSSCSNRGHLEPVIEIRAKRNQEEFEVVLQSQLTSPTTQTP